MKFFFNSASLLKIRLHELINRFIREVKLASQEGGGGGGG
jgi:hypothetical protein